MSTSTSGFMWTLGEAHHALQARGIDAQRVGDAGLAFARVHTDTRTLQAGDLFVALRGERFDAHDYLPQAFERGAVAVLSERPLTLPGLVVPDTRAALLALAGAWRAQFTLPLIAVTGSNGKTTVTQMLASIVRAWVGREAAFATEGNFNNDIGVPLTLLRLRGEHRAGVVEIGMNHPGEIAPLATLAAPTVALVNNAQREHQEFMATVEATAEENGAVISALHAGGTAVYPADDACAPIWQRLAAGHARLTFARSGAAEVSADAQWRGTHWHLALRTPAGAVEAVLALPGAHNVHNALAATAAALAAGCPLTAIAAGLSGFEAAKGRSQLKTLRWKGAEAQLVDDSYNANPDSMRAAASLLAALPGPRWMLMGDMGEVGTQGPAFHAEVGAHAAELGLDQLWCVGDAARHAARAFGPGARHFDTVEQAIDALGDGPDAKSLLVKGSRFMRMERIVAALAAQGSPAC